MSFNQPKFLSVSGEMATLTRQFDWASTAIGPFQDWAQSLRTTVGIILASSSPMFLWWGDDLIQFYNDAYRPSMGDQGKHPKALGQRAQDCWPEIWPIIKPLIDHVLAGKGATYSENQLIPIFRNGQIEDVYWTFGYSPVMDESDEIRGVLVVCQETTKTVTANRLLQLSESRFRSIVEQAPIAIGLLKGKDMVVEVGNNKIFEIWGKDKSIIGMKLIDALPEIKDQPFPDLLSQVYETAKPYFGTEALARLEHNGDLINIYFDFTYMPLVDGLGGVTGVLVLAIDVTEQVLSRQKIVQAESSLRGAVELAQLGTFQIDLMSGTVQYSDRLREWFEIKKGEIITFETAYSAVCEADQLAVIEAVTRTVMPGNNGVYDIEYSMKPDKTGVSRILHAQGKTHCNENGEPVTMMGAVQDVTEQRKVQLALEQLVQQRTWELEMANQELASSNEELNKLNDLLARSNESLEQFAYVASHDLQEPLRKVQTFSQLLLSRYGEQLTGNGQDYLLRMHKATTRMSALIDDLFTFSKLSINQDVPGLVQLDEVIKSVLSVLELTIQETGAQIEIEKLPVMVGDTLQLEQLFQNLLSNALKFRDAATKPKICILYTNLTEDMLPDLVKPVRASDFYHRIEVKDNGIGFDTKDAQRIFEVFQRLHGKSAYSGTGIGLAICKKVVTNHGGAILASSHPGQGSTFTIIFPN